MPRFGVKAPSRDKFVLKSEIAILFSDAPLSTAARDMSPP